MKILFLDQSGKCGGAELCLLDLVSQFYQHQTHEGLVALFEDGHFREQLEAHHIPVRVLAQKAIQVRKNSGLSSGLTSIGRLIPLMTQVTALSRTYDVIYANTQKALVVGAIASALSGRPLVYHLHDILSLEHFSATNRRLAVLLANRAAIVIANSEATRSAFIEAGGNPERVAVVYNGFEPKAFLPEGNSQNLRASLGLEERFIVGHFSRLSPWKGQHILLDALTHCHEDVVAIFVGDALFGEQAYVQDLQAQVDRLGLRDRVRFLGFRADVIPLMHLCDVIAHTSTAAEPFGRVIVESMLCGKPTIAAKAGAAIELIEPGVTGWLVSPGDSLQLAKTIENCRQDPETALLVAKQAQHSASQRFDLEAIHHQLSEILNSRLTPKRSV